jgi:hypothetical protein
MFSTQDLKIFLVEATQFGYGNPDKAKVEKEKDLSTTIQYENGDWRIHDNFFGGEPYGGREVVFYKNKPVFIMVYYGFVHKNVKNVDAVYTFLQNCLKKIPPEYPYRGPEQLKENDLQYNNNWHGEIENFVGKEEILENNEQVYSAQYIGGLVDQRVSDEI